MGILDEETANNTTVQYTENGVTFHSLPQPPQSERFHCMAVLKDGNVFVVSGYCKCTFLYHSEERQWKECPGARFTKQLSSGFYQDFVTNVNN
jgi:hypothetical protein